MSAKGQKRGRGNGQGNGKGAGIVIRREEAAEAPAHGGSWKIAYADFVTAMMAFFLLMWLINATTEAQRQGLANYFSPSNVWAYHYSGSGKPFGGRTPYSVGEQVSDKGAIEVITGHAEPERNARSDPRIRSPGALAPNGAPVPPIRPGSPPPTVTAATGGLANANPTVGGTAGPDLGAPALPVPTALSAGHEQAAFAHAADEVRAALRQDPALSGLASHVAIDITAQGLRIQIMDGKHRPMFALGSPSLAPPARLFVARLAPILARLSGPIAISGYTDAAPYHGHGNGQGDAMSNWDLSAERANATRSLLVADGLPEPRIARVSGYADRDLLLPADPLAAANRRIAILVMPMGQGVDKGVNEGMKAAPSVPR